MRLSTNIESAKKYIIANKRIIRIIIKGIFIRGLLTTKNKAMPVNLLWLWLNSLQERLPAD